LFAVAEINGGGHVLLIQGFRKVGFLVNSVHISFQSH